MASQKIAVIGAGLIGRAWAIVFARAGFAVAIHDSAPGEAGAAFGLIAEGFAELARAGFVDDPKAAAARVRVAASVAEAVQDAGFVQENLPENLAVKRAIFAELDRLAPPDAILASSTSTIVSSLFTETLEGRSRCLVAHPVNPPHLVPIVELVGAPWTAPETIARAKALYEQAGRCRLW